MSQPGFLDVVQEEVNHRQWALIESRRYLESNCPLMFGQCSAIFLESSISNNKVLKSAICAKNMGKNEACYSCLECARDETTVLCRQCFENSEHTSHDFNITLSSGNGSCDCGDSEAWSSCNGCAVHKGIDSHTIEEVRQFFPESVFNGIVNHELPKIFSQLFNDLILTKDYFYDHDSLETYYLILINNEIHNFSSVKDVLSMKVGQIQGYHCAALVDYYGCSHVLEGNLNECEEFSKYIADNSKINNYNIHLKTLIVSKERYLKFLIAESCLKILAEMDDRLRFVLCGYLLSAYDDNNDNQTKKQESGLSHLKFYIENESKLIQSSRNAFIKLFCDFCLRFVSIRRLFALFFDENYGKILENCKELYESTNTFMISMELQIYTAESIVLELLDNSNSLLKFFILGISSDLILDKDQSFDDSNSNVYQLNLIKHLMPLNSLHFFLNSINPDNLNALRLVRIIMALSSFLKFVNTLKHGVASLDMKNLNTHYESRSSQFLRTKLLSISKLFERLLSNDPVMMHLAIHVILFHMHNQVNFEQLDMFANPNILDDNVEFDYFTPLYPIRITLLSNFLNSYFKIMGNTSYFNDLLTKIPDISHFKSLDENFDEFLYNIYPNNCLTFSRNIIDRIYIECIIVDVYLTLVSNLVINNSELASSYFLTLVRHRTIACSRVHLIQMLISMQDDWLIQEQMVQQIIDVFKFYTRNRKSSKRITDYSTLMYLLQLLYSRNIIDNCTTKDIDQKISLIVHYSLLDNMNLGSIMALIDIEKKMDKDLLTKVTDFRFLRSGTFVKLKNVYMKYFNIFKAAYPIRWIESALEHLLEIGMSSDYLLIPMKPENPYFDFDKGFYINPAIHRIIVNTFRNNHFNGFFGILAIFYAMNALQEFNLYDKTDLKEKELLNFGNTNDKRSSYLIKSYEYLKANNFNSELSNKVLLQEYEEFKCKKNSIYQNSNISHSDIGPRNEMREFTLRKIENMQKAFQETYKDIIDVSDDEDDNSMIKSHQITNSDIYYFDRSNYDKDSSLECINCHEKSSKFDTIITTLIFVTTPSKFPLYSKLPLTCGHPIHKSCNANNEKCIFCTMPYSYSSNECILMKYSPVDIDLNSIADRIKQFTNFIAWILKCDELRESTRINFLNKYKFLAYHFYFRNILIDPLIRFVKQCKYDLTPIIGNLNNKTHSDILIIIFIMILSLNSLKSQKLLMGYILKSFHSVDIDYLDSKYVSFALRFLVAFLSIANNFKIYDYPDDLKNDINKYHYDLINFSLRKENKSCDHELEDVFFEKLIQEHILKVDYVKLMENISNSFGAIKIPLPDENLVDLISHSINIPCPTLNIFTDKIYCFKCGSFGCYPAICCIRLLPEGYNSNEEYHHTSNFICHSNDCDNVGLILTSGTVVIYSEFYKNDVLINSLNPYVDHFSSRHGISGKSKLDLKILNEIERIIFERRAVEYFN